MACDDGQLAYSVMLRNKSRYVPVYYLVCKGDNYDAICFILGSSVDISCHLSDPLTEFLCKACLGFLTFFL